MNSRTIWMTSLKSQQDARLYFSQQNRRWKQCVGVITTTARRAGSNSGFYEILPLESLGLCVTLSVIALLAESLWNRVNTEGHRNRWLYRVSHDWNDHQQNRAQFLPPVFAPSDVKMLAGLEGLRGGVPSGKLAVTPCTVSRMRRSKALESASNSTFRAVCTLPVSRRILFSFLSELQLGRES